MTYSNISGAVFVDRPNRFIAHVELDGHLQVCHVKNTGRCRELLVPGARVLVQRIDKPGRKTDLDLIGVWKGQRLINMDAAAPNRVFAEWALAGGFLPGLTLLKAEAVHGDSRFDFYLEAGPRRGFVEVKGVTLEEDGVVRFPDAPTERGVKHLRGLERCVQEGYQAWAVFVIQMEGVRHFSPNWATHPQFGQALIQAQSAGVRLLAMDCHVTETSLAIRAQVPIKL
ncbi:MAG TPA: DNA/RNA nuclease SfsA [Candidatus Excrementavichristensenella intestinipullorum]|nr:DNA/RNA nuclease SfsA [Candidatus Excrementavichristensenella intestinipullorum]